MRFFLGKTVITPGALAALTNGGLLASLGRHAAGDWGDVCEEDMEANEQALHHGFRLLSSYRSESGIEVLDHRRGGSVGDDDPPSRGI